MTEQQKDIRELNCLIATVVTHGHVDESYAAAHEEMRVFNERQGFQNVEYRRESAVLVEEGRDRAVRHMLAENYDAILQIDADMCGFPPESFIKLLEDLFVIVPHADAIGGYCNLKGHPFLPTIDTGTGTWENWYPGSGIIPVIRTGCAFLMCKQSAFRRFGPPWFRARLANQPLGALRDVDNIARCWLDGENPFRDDPNWLSLVEEAKKRGGIGEGGIGEDSGFCDRLKAAGGHIFVDTDIVCGHVDKRVIDWRDHKRAMEERERFARLAVGVMR